MSRRSARGAAASPRRPGLLARWHAWRRHHSLSAADSLARVLRQPLASLVTWLVIGIAIALPAGFWLILDNVSGVSERFQTSARLSVFLASGVDLPAARTLAEAWREEEGIEAVAVLPRDQALAEFVERSGLADLTASLPENPLPHLLLVTPASEDPALAAALQGRLEARLDVDEVIVDAQWLHRLQRLMAVGERAVQLLTLLLLGAVVLVLGNTIRLAIESRREEIEVVKLVGGSDAFVRRPLLYTGLWYGLGGGVVAALTLALVVMLLTPPVADLAAAYGSPFRLHGLGLVNSLQLVLIGGALGLSGAWLAVARHLREIQPEGP